MNIFIFSLFRNYPVLAKFCYALLVILFIVSSLACKRFVSSHHNTVCVCVCMLLTVTIQFIDWDIWIKQYEKDSFNFWSLERWKIIRLVHMYRHTERKRGRNCFIRSIFEPDSHSCTHTWSEKRARLLLNALSVGIQQISELQSMYIILYIDEM